MVKIKQEDLKENKLYCILIPFYTIVLAVVYGWWMFVLQDSKSPWGTMALVATFVLPTVIVIGGAVCFYLSNLKVAKKRIAREEQAEDKVEEQNINQ